MAGKPFGEHDPRPGKEVSAPDQIGRRLREARTARGISLREMARRIKVSPSFVSQVERGKANPSVGTLYAFVGELGVSLDDLTAERFDPDQVATAADSLRGHRRRADVLGSAHRRLAADRDTRAARARPPPDPAFRGRMGAAHSRR